MPVTTKKNKSSNVIIVKKMKDYNEDPVFKKKAKEAAASLKKHGLPERFKKKNK